MKIAFLGPKGSYSYFAAIKYAKKKYKNLKKIPCKDFKSIVKKIKKKNIYAILPVKNSITGKIDETKKIFKKNKLKIFDKIKISINHCILSKKKQSLKNIKLIYSHSQPIKQCQIFINNLKNLKIKYTNSSSEAIKKILNKKNKFSAAIGSENCNKLYKLHIIKRNISNYNKNKTLFYIVLKK
ncbi:MAG: hypothetical protein G8D27_00745 [Buchnera aphidicola (Periphyllus aceris)]|nr:hypothetical protein [Buchnera aphidicola (Periphyllus aceris)]